MSFRSLTATENGANDSSHRRLCRQRSNSEPTCTGMRKDNINSRDSKGRTLLFYAARYGQTEVAKSLLEALCDPNIPDCNRSTALHEAVDNSNHEIVKYLIKYGCNVNVKNILGQTPLMKSVIFDDTEIMKTLCRAGADIDEIDCTGKSALLHGLQEQRQKACMFLIKIGCDVNVVDVLGQSALFLTAQANSEFSMSLFRRILKAGYDVSKDSSWLDENNVISKIMRRPSFLKRICGLLGIKSTKSKDDKSDITDFHDDVVDRTTLRVRN